MTSQFPKKIPLKQMDMTSMDRILDDLFYQITYGTLAPEDLSLYGRKLLNAYIAQRLGSDGVKYISERLSKCQ